ncbi:YegP family protein [Patulibacter defluvii]|uniref:YegP family protein n=1 Tax=Patulibacter defluvii TaxID=3095358 RepID=UPI002A74D297|nr:YegP family protein [Patulibacter sp. DM4]
MPNLEVYADAGGNYRWRLKSTNGQTVAGSGEAFSSKSSAKRAAKNVQARATEFKDEVYADSGGKHRWRLTSSNGQTVATSGQSFASKGGAQKAVDAARKTAASSTLVEV